MTTIQTNCPSCGVVQLSSDRLALSYDLMAYVFRCPVCHRGVTKRTDRNIVKLLQAAGVVTLGVKYGHSDLADGLSAAEPLAAAPAAPVITNDDVLDFHLNIDAELDGLLGSGPVG